MKCKRCKVEKNLNDTGRCQGCDDYCKNYYLNNRQQEIDRAKRIQNKDRKKTNAYKKELNRKNPLSIILQHAKARAKKKDIPFDLTIGDIVVPECCPVLGLRLAVNKGHAKEDSMTIDRIVPELGYVKGNVAIISFKANTIKNNASIEEIEKVLIWMKDQWNEKKI